MARARRFLALFLASSLLGVSNGVRHLAARDSAVDVPLGLGSLAVAVASAGAAWGVWRGARWTYGAVVVWAAALVGATVSGAVLLRAYMPRAWDRLPGPAGAAILAAVVVWRAHRRLRNPAP